MVPLGGSGFGAGGTGNTIVRIFVPAGTPSSPLTRPVITPSPAPPTGFVPLTGATPVTTPGASMAGASPGPPGSQSLAINVTGPDDDQSKRYCRTECERLHSGTGRDGVSTLADAAGRDVYRYRWLGECGDRIYRCTVE